MARIALIACLLCLSLGCGRRGTTIVAPAKSDPRDDMPATERVRKAVPVLNRTLTQVDLSQLQTYLNQYHASHNKYPKTLDDLKELDVPRDAPKIASAIQKGELVLHGGEGGILAYEAIALDDRGSVLTINGIVIMTADELKQKLGQSRS